MAIKAVTYLFVILISVFIAACSGSKSSGSLKSTQWELTSLTELGSSFQVKPTVEFSADGKISGFGGCNKFTGKYKVNGENITLTGIEATDLACDNTPLESAFLLALQKSSTYKIENSKLYLYSNGVLEAVLRKVSN